MNPEPPSPIRTVLIVDDQPSVLVTLRFVLGDAYRVVSVDSGEKALLAEVDQPIDGAIVDLHMPGINGIETCRRLLAQAPASSRPPRVWIMSAAATVEARRLAAEAGAIGFFTKPFPDDLLDQLAVGFSAAPRRAPEPSGFAAPILAPSA